MGKSRTNGKANASSLTIVLDAASKDTITRAAELRGIGVSDFVQRAAVAQARKELAAAEQQVIAMTPEEQLAFWKALNAPVKLTAAQKKLGRLMRGEKPR